MSVQSVEIGEIREHSVEVNESPSVTSVEVNTVLTSAELVEIGVVGTRGPQGLPGTPGAPGTNPEDIPDMTLIFENGLI